MLTSPMRTPLMEASSVVVIQHLDHDAANDNGGVAGSRRTRAFPKISPAVAFSAGFAVAGLIVALETMLRHSV